MGNKREAQAQAQAQAQHKTIIDTPDTPVERVESSRGEEKKKLRLLPVPKDMQPGQLPEGRLIWDYERFPSHTRPYSFTPQDVAQAIDRFATTIEPWTEIMKQYGITRHGWYGSPDWPAVPALYPEIRQAHALAAVRKADAFDSEQHWLMSLEQNRDGLPDWLFDISRNDPGKEVLTAAGVQWLRERRAYLREQALRHETGTRVPKQQVESRSLSIHADLSQPRGGTAQTRDLPRDLSEREPGEIVDWIFGGSGPKRLPGA